MRLRPAHIAIFVVVGLTAFVGFVAYRQYYAPTVITSVNPDEAFIETVRQRAETRPGAGERGTLPGTAVGAQFVPQIDFGMEAFDGGVIPNDRHTVFEVPVYNRGQGNLIISDINTSCMACTLGEMASSDPIRPGQAGTLLITLKPEGIPAFQSNQNLVIMSNDPRRPRTFLPVRVEVEPEFELIPSDIDFGTVTAGEQVSKTVLLRPLEDEPIEVTDVVYLEIDDPSRLEYALASAPEDSWARPGFPEYEITLTIREDALPGEAWREHFVIHNSTQRAGRFRASATGSIVPPTAEMENGAEPL